MPEPIVKLNLRTEEAKQDLQEMLADSMRELMNGPVKSEAQRLCPRSEKLRKGEEKHTADTIAVRVRKTRKGIGGSIFTQSGHGAYIEAGTKDNAAQPFLLPALMRHARDLPLKLGAKIKTLSGLHKLSKGSLNRIKKVL